MPSITQVSFMCWITKCTGGPYPIDLDGHVHDFLIQSDNVIGERGTFWVEQFELAWHQSHSYENEKQYNKNLA